MIDTHCHVFSEYFDDIPSLLIDIKKNGIEKIIVNGTDMKSNLEVLRLVKEYDCVYGAIGFHPTELDSFNNEHLKWLEEHINDDKIVAIGEIGLDYHYQNDDKNMQIDIFKRQLEIASKYKKPVIVHSRDAIKDTYDILNNFKLRGSIHCFSGSLEMAIKFIKLGFYIGIGGVSTYENAKNIVDVIKNISLEYILLETDSPYLTPVPLRGQLNTPKNIAIIARKISQIKDVLLEDVVNITTLNATSLFDFL